MRRHLKGIARLATARSQGHARDQPEDHSRPHLLSLEIILFSEYTLSCSPGETPAGIAKPICFWWRDHASSKGKSMVRREGGEVGSGSIYDNHIE